MLPRELRKVVREWAELTRGEYTSTALRGTAPVDFHRGPRRLAFRAPVSQRQGRDPSIGVAEFIYARVTLNYDRG